MGWDRRKAEGPLEASGGSSVSPDKAERNTSQKRPCRPRVPVKYVLCSDLQSSSRKNLAASKDQDELVISEATLISLSLWNKVALSCLRPNNFLKQRTVTACLGSSWLCKAVVRTMGMDRFMRQLHKRPRVCGDDPLDGMYEKTL